jgi:hypothetical protein
VEAQAAAVNVHQIMDALPTCLPTPVGLGVPHLLDIPVIEESEVTVAVSPDAKARNKTPQAINPACPPFRA